MSVSDTGFQLEDMKVKGPLIVLNSTVLLWDVPQYGVGGPTGDVEPLEKGAWTDTESPFYGWSTAMFKVFEIIEPKPEILVLGCGSILSQFPPTLMKYLNNLGIQVEIYSSQQAATTFKILSQEGRNVSLALLPPFPTSARSGKLLVEVYTSSN
ncbi:NADH dehydrogenase 1 alpha subcomplex assembly factor 3 [Globomyces pollinis-pini]|nr:NADH dehydrogenase 1 alpha subcomplex assembly factor 3 [Globomyces pollinis-pini]